MDVLLSPKEVAERLAISERQLRSLTREGAISYINVGLGSKRPAMRYDPADVEAFIESRKRGGSSMSAPPREATPVRQRDIGRFLPDKHSVDDVVVPRQKRVRQPSTVERVPNPLAKGKRRKP